jgi:glutamate racemase
MIAPCSAADITEDREPAESAEPSEAAEPIENAEPTEPTEPIETAEPTEPIDSSDPFEQIESSESSDHRESLESPSPGAVMPAVSQAARIPAVNANVPDPSLPIAVFDSGVGGLTVLHECLVSLPEEDYVYLGDDARFPYGAKADAELRECAQRNTAFLLERGTKLIVIACNSAASAGLKATRALAAEQGVEVVAVIEPEAEIAAAITDSGRVGVLATAATVAGGAYLRALGSQHRELTVTQVAAPDLAAIIQRGFPFSEDVVETVRSYCAPLKRARVDTVILGCTHYPLVRPMLQRFLGREVRLVTAGHALAATAQRILESRRLEAVDDTEGTYRFICTGDPAAFRELGTRFLQLPLGEVEHVVL